MVWFAEGRAQRLPQLSIFQGRERLQPYLGPAGVTVPTEPDRPGTVSPPERGGSTAP